MMSHKRRNLLLISLDTLRVDIAYSGLPHLQWLCTQGTAFRHAVASAPITPVSHASVFTGLQPYTHGIRHLFKEQLVTSVPTLAQLLLAAGYQTGAIVSCPGLHRWYGLNAGFTHYDDDIPRLHDGSDPLRTVDVKQRGTALKRAPLVVERGLTWLETHRQKPFFCFLHFFDTHWPYEPPTWFAPTDANPYEGEAYYVDHFLGTLMAQLTQWGLLENTLIILFSDHGEDLAGWYTNDHAGPELGHPEEEGHGCLLYDATQMVPLIFVAPGLVPESLWVDTQVRLVDILPTVVDLLDLHDSYPRAGYTLRGLFDVIEPHRVAYCETYYREEQSLSGRGVPGLGPWKALRIDNRLKLILDVNTQSLMFYNLEDDPHERYPIVFGAEQR
jgi:arylsulfatase